MKIEPASKQFEAAFGATHQVTLTADDLTETTADTAQTFTVAAPAGTLAQVIATAVPTAFKDASDAAFNTNVLTIGDEVDPDRYLASQELNENGTEVLYKAGTGVAYAYTADDTIDITIAAMAAKSLVNIDTGELRILLKAVPLTA